MLPPIHALSTQGSLPCGGSLENPGAMPPHGQTEKQGSPWHIVDIETITYAFLTKEMVFDWLPEGSKTFRFAYEGKAPQVSTCKPGRDIAAQAGIA